ncbi:hypothetical protein ISN44_As07g012940 [Arabidopsis suecica]|uniref:Uncharacterized protein n=1 Tax=Arabidopsis suecica TaxID=45249 RepID=A0A8T2BNK4_ARASU|nr:hypothetical protein ISN44_As07g012940 [Arabidopsis suecica]
MTLAFQLQIEINPDPSQLRRSPTLTSGEIKLQSSSVLLGLPVVTNQSYHLCLLRLKQSQFLHPLGTVSSLPSLSRPMNQKILLEPRFSISVTRSATITTYHCRRSQVSNFHQCLDCSLFYFPKELSVITVPLFTSL